MNTNSTFDIPNDSNDTSHGQSHFMAVLPADIVFEIFAYLTQQDSLTCMEVCHDWYSLIPEYAQYIWAELRLDPRDIYGSHMHCKRRLGSYVKRVIIRPFYESAREEDLYALMERLLDWNCTVIQSFELANWEIADHVTFLDLLQQLAHHLTHLKLLRVDASVAPTSLLDRCPELTHFTCQETSFEDVCEYAAPIPNAPTDRPTLITHLVLDAIITDKSQLACILKKCPDLRSLIGISEVTWLRYLGTSYDHSVSIDLDSLFFWCPKIAFLAANFCYISLHRFDDDPDTYIGNKVGLRYLRESDTHGLDQTARQLTKNQHTLELLSIRKSRLDWGPVFQSLHFPQLCTLNFSNYGCTTASLVTLLNHCPALETLDLNCSLIHDPTATQSLDTMHQLHTLRWGLRANEAEFSLYPTLERCPALKKLTLFLVGDYFEPPRNFTGLRQLKWIELDGELCDIMADDVSMSKQAAVPLLFKYLADNSKVTEIHFSKVLSVSFEAMLNIAAVTTLKVLDIPIDPRLSEEQQIEFVQMLAQTAVESLTLYNIPRLSFSILDALAALPLLTGLFTQRVRSLPFVTPINKSGLQQMLSRSKNLTIISLGIHMVIKEDGTPIAHHQVRKRLLQQTLRHGFRWNIEMPEGQHGHILSGLTISRVNYN